MTDEKRAQLKRALELAESKVADMREHVKNGTYCYKLSDYNAEIYFTEQKIISIKNELEGNDND